MIHNYFDGSFYINLDSRQDRRKEVEVELAKYAIVSERLVATEGNPSKKVSSLSNGNLGCVSSHLECIRLAKERKWKSVLIFEDDVEFKDNVNELFTEWWEEVPVNWDMVYLGGNHTGANFKNSKRPKINKVTNHVYRTRHTLTTHAYVIRETIYDQMIRFFDNINDVPVDLIYTMAQDTYNVYTFVPNLAWQRPGYSDIVNGYRNYKWMKNA